MFQEDYRRIDAMMQQKGIFTHEGTGKPYYTGYEYATLYDWDQYFETIVQLYLGWKTTYARSGVEIFLDIQREDGHIQRSSKGEPAQLSEHVKPFLAQICLLIYNRDGDIDFLRANGFHAPKPFKELVKLPEGIIGLGTKMGEGWLLTAEMVELVQSGYGNIVCAQPFGCLPNHIVGKGMAGKIRALYPAANITAIDYDPSATRVNQENRIKLMLAVAREQLEKT